MVIIFNDLIEFIYFKFSFMTETKISLTREIQSLRKKKVIIIFKNRNKYLKNLKIFILDTWIC